MKSLCIVAALTAFTFAACDSKQENQREKALETQADNLEKDAHATRKAAENKADTIESTEKHGTDKLKNNTPADKDADAVRKSGDAAADRLEKKADLTREAK